MKNLHNDRIVHKAVFSTVQSKVRSDTRVPSALLRSLSSHGDEHMTCADEQDQALTLQCKR